MKRIVITEADKDRLRKLIPRLEGEDKYLIHLVLNYIEQQGDTDKLIQQFFQLQSDLIEHYVPEGMEAKPFYEYPKEPED